MPVSSIPLMGPASAVRSEDLEIKRAGLEEGTSGNPVWEDLGTPSSGDDFQLNFLLSLNIGYTGKGWWQSNNNWKDTHGYKEHTHPLAP